MKIGIYIFMAPLSFPAVAFSPKDDTVRQLAINSISDLKTREFHDLLFENYNKLSDQKIQEIAQAVGLNLEEYEKKKKDPAIERKVRQDFSEGRQAGVRGTPTIFINGIRLRDRSLKGFQAAIDKQLQKLGKTATKPSS